MHEFSVAQSLLERVEREAQARSATAVLRIELRLGAASGIEVELLRSAWELVSADSRVRDARLDIVTVPVRWRCPRCAREPATGTVLRCPDCLVPARLVEGAELVLQRLELDVAPLEEEIAHV